MINAVRGTLTFLRHFPQYIHDLLNAAERVYAALIELQEIFTAVHDILADAREEIRDELELAAREKRATRATEERIKRALAVARGGQAAGEPEEGGERPEEETLWMFGEGEEAGGVDGPTSNGPVTMKDQLDAFRRSEAGQAAMRSLHRS